MSWTATLFVGSCGESSPAFCFLDGESLDLIWLDPPISTLSSCTCNGEEEACAGFFIGFESNPEACPDFALPLAPTFCPAGTRLPELSKT